MALETLTTQQMLANTYEPKRKFRWILQIDGIDAYTMKTSARPESTFEETMIDYMNAKRWISGKQTWNPIQCVMYDPIAPSAASKVMDWMRLNYEYQTGRMGYATFYKKEISLKLTDPQGTVVEFWDIFGAWPQNINWGELDYASSDNTEITFSLRFDGAQLVY